VKNTPSPAEANEDVGAPGASPKEWYSRGYLPHRDAKQLLQAVTFRLADSLPQEKLKLLEEELSNLPENQRATHRREKIEQWLDAGMGCCAPRHPKLAEQTRNALLHFDGQRYQLLAWSKSVGKPWTGTWIPATGSCAIFMAGSLPRSWSNDQTAAGFCGAGAASCAMANGTSAPRESKGRINFIIGKKESSDF